jgi:hypothetical protein
MKVHHSQSNLVHFSLPVPERSILVLSCHTLLSLWHGLIQSVLLMTVMYVGTPPHLQATSLPKGVL